VFLEAFVRQQVAPLEQANAVNRAVIVEVNQQQMGRAISALNNEPAFANVPGSNQPFKPSL
jgi:hypothetical protein